MATTAKPEEATKQVDEELIKKVKELPLKERFKAAALNNIFKQNQKIEKEMAKEMRKLQYKYDQLANAFYTKSNELIEGTRVPTAEELTEAEKFLSAEELAKKDEVLKEAAAPVEGYWLKVLKNSPVLKHHVTTKDEGAMKHLKRVVVKTKEDVADLTVEFTFGPNDYFTNEVLTKTVLFDEDEKPIKTTGTTIEWKEGKNLTKKTVKKKQKNKKTGAQRTVTKEVPDESFFNFFGDSKPCEGDHDHDDEDDEGMGMEEMQFELDVEIAEEFQNELIPDSLEYYLGVVRHEEDFEDEDYDDDEDMDDEDDDEDDDHHGKKPRKKSSKKEESEEEDEAPKGKGKPKKKSGDAGKDGAKPECKQQ